MSGAQWVQCQAGIWTQVSNLPCPFGFVYVWSRDGTVRCRWRRYQDTPPFYTEDSATILPGQNTWVVPPALINTWWFKPDTGVAVLRLT